MRNVWLRNTLRNTTALDLNSFRCRIIVDNEWFQTKLGCIISYILNDKWRRPTVGKQNTTGWSWICFWEWRHTILRCKQFSIGSAVNWLIQRHRFIFLDYSTYTFHPSHFLVKLHPTAYAIIITRWRSSIRVILFEM